jgi:hypothetical protein
LAEIWNSDAYRAVRAAERAGKNTSPLCRNCSEAPGFNAGPPVAPPPGYPHA